MEKPKENLANAFTSIAIGMILIFAMIGFWRPFNMGFIKYGLDPSWMAATAEALDRHFSFGVNFIYGTGPLTPIYTDAFVKSYWIVIIVCKLYLACFSAYILFRFLSKPPLLASVPAIALLFIMPGVRNAVLFVPILLAGIAFTRRVGSLAIACLSGLTCAILTLTKFSVVPLAIYVVLMGDVLRFRSGQYVPVTILSYVVCSSIIFLLVGQSLYVLPAFFVTSLDVAVGYVEAMGIPGSTTEFAGWLACAGLAFVAVLRLRRGIATRYGQNELESWSEVVLVAMFLWLSMKAGFIRHDLHSLTSWTLLIFLALLYVPAAILLSPAWPRMVLLGVSAVAAVVSGSLAVGSLVYGVTENPAAIVRAGLDELVAGLSLIVNPSVTISKWHYADAAARASISAEHPLPQLEGTVDVLASRQSELIANGLNYWPRPSVQEYTTYTKALISANQRFFEGRDAPDYFIFEPGSIDGRHPASAEGASWPILLSRYEPVQFIVGDQFSSSALLLKRRSKATQVSVADESVAWAKIGENVANPFKGDVVFLKLDVELSLPGKLAALLFKPAPVSLQLNYHDGSTESYRLIPREAKEGFLISPYVGSAIQFGMLYAAENSLARWVDSMAVVPFKGFGWQYSSQIRASFDRLDISQALLAGSNSQALSQFKSWLADNRPILRRNTMHPPFTDVSIADGVFAHAPSELLVDTENNTAMSLRFGIRKGAYQDSGHTDGVCFKVASNTTVLFDRCLKPSSSISDRGDQEAYIRVPMNETLRLITDCAGNCAWDWAYWKSVRLNQYQSSN